MKQRPILFNAPMVRALLDGTKTQTRRAMKPQMVYGNVCGLFNSWYLPKGKDGGTLWPNAKEQILATCPYGQVGDQLWVRETFMDMRGTGIEHDGKGDYYYRADVTDYGEESRKDYGLKWKPSIFMPRAASRITLEITSVRVERLQDVTAADALAEGVIQLPDGGYSLPDTKHYSDSPDESYASLWESINGSGSWDLNPWVWVIEFKRVQP